LRIGGFRQLPYSKFCQYTSFLPFAGELSMNHLLRYLSSAPVLAAVWFAITAGILIEFNRFYPDLLFHPL
jgi:photosystem I subunit 9